MLKTRVLVPNAVRNVFLTFKREMMAADEVGSSGNEPPPQEGVGMT